MVKPEEVIQSCKDQLKIHISSLLEMGVRKQSLEIELLHFIKNEIYKE